MRQWKCSIHNTQIPWENKKTEFQSSNHCFKKDQWLNWSFMNQPQLWYGYTLLTVFN